MTPRLHEMGRAFSLMMSQNWFSSTARKINTPHLFLRLMDNFLTRCMMLPPPDPLAAKPFEVKQNVGSAGCCGKTERVMVIMPNTTMQRTTHQLRRRQRVINEHDNVLKNEALQQEPTVEELEKDKPSLFISKLSPKDWVIWAITLVACVGVLLLLNLHHFTPYVSLTSACECRTTACTPRRCWATR